MAPFPAISAAILSGIGFLVARFIFRTKRAGRKLICPVGSDCDVVVQSKYSRIFGISVDVLGMVYYAITAVAFVGLAFFPSLATVLVLRFMLGITALALLFTLYLVAVQMFVLKEWCIWCLVSSMVTLAIFILMWFDAMHW